MNGESMAWWSRNDLCTFHSSQAWPATASRAACASTRRTSPAWATCSPAASGPPETPSTRDASPSKTWVHSHKEAFSWLSCLVEMGREPSQVTQSWCDSRYMFSSNPKEILALLSVTIRTKLCLHYEIMYFFLPEINRFCSANMLFIFFGVPLRFCHSRDCFNIVHPYEY